MGGGATRSPAVSADAGAGAGTGAAGAEFLATLLLSSSSRNAACSRACRSLCSSSSFSLKKENRVTTLMKKFGILDRSLDDSSSFSFSHSLFLSFSFVLSESFYLPFVHHGRHEAQRGGRRRKHVGTVSQSVQRIRR